MNSADADALYERILPTWKAARPSVEAQSIRAGMTFDGDVEDAISDYVWLIADIAAQRAFEKAGATTTPSRKKDT